MKRKQKRSAKRGDAMRVWAEIEEHFVPKMRVWLAERVLYFYLMRTVRLAGKRMVTTSIGHLAKVLCLSKTAARSALRRLARRGVLRILSRDRDGHRVEVKSPREIAGVVGEGKRSAEVLSLDDCFRAGVARRAIFEREGYRCFYCLRHLAPTRRVLDHVRARSRGGNNSYRNVVACCPACNSMKKDMSAEKLLRQHYRSGLLGRREFYGRMEALRELRYGRLKPRITKMAA